ncbi:MAG: DNA helicase RecQ [Bacteroidota bacterium]
MTISAAQTALKKYFGYDHFRPMQGEIIETVLAGKDTLVLMPTGGGKSICYQIPAIIKQGVCIVVSPLISLMKDQVESLKANGIKAAYLNSSLSSGEQQEVEDQLYHGQIKLLYVSPERLCSPSFTPLLKQANLSLIAIDEAHCISSWGHDFRPEYTQLAFLKRQFAQVPLIALTATADRLTRQDIIDQLRLEQPACFVASFDRPNISLEVRPGQKRMEQILDFVQQRPNQSGIIYCLSRKSTEEVAAKLLAKGIKAGFYHAGLSPVQRNRVQDAFINDATPVVCATVAFGMGIDKSNVRWVIHYNLPKNMESYYQEIGRCGRDGAKADTLLFYSFRDVMVLRDILRKNDSDQIEVKLAKLERMQQYADSLICRRKILLNYFNEELEDNCGNCDVCKDPPQYFDGTIIAQKALSAITRLKEKAPMGLLIDVLRGSRRREIFQLGYDKIKTYGAGADISYVDWQHLMGQLLSVGLIDIAYEHNNALRLTPASREVLFNNRKVQLVKMAAIKERMKAQQEKIKPQSQRQRVRDELFEVLRQLRKTMAKKHGVPPYIIFSDASLEEMAAERPINAIEMRRISGVGEVKLKRYGRPFVEAIIQFIEKKSAEGASIKGSTQLLTCQLFRRGLSPEAIAIERELNVSTIYTHLADSYEAGEDINIGRLISKEEIKAVFDALQKLPEPYKLKAIHSQLDEEMPYGKIKLAMAYFRKKEQEVL